MSTHLTECRLRNPRDLMSEDDCICDRLRAREARVRAIYEVPTGVWDEQSWNAALDAARDAVERVGQQHPKWDLMSTHYEGCWKSHPECALTLALSVIQRLIDGGGQG